jgi:hypothetical protein
MKKNPILEILIGAAAVTTAFYFLSLFTGDDQVGAAGEKDDDNMTALPATGDGVKAHPQPKEIIVVQETQPCYFPTDMLIDFQNVRPDYGRME